MPFHQQVHRQATETPDKPAFVMDGQIRTYGELSRRSKSFFAFIASLPDRSHTRSVLKTVGKVIALDLGNHLLFPEMFMGATAGSNVCAVLDPKMLPAQVEDVVARLQPDLMITETLTSAAASLAARMGIRVEPASAFERQDQGNGVIDMQPSPEMADGPFLVGFTSGTTSQPKAYSRSRASWRASLERGLSLFGLYDAPATLCPGALAHGLALYALSETLYSGGTFHTVKQWNADSVTKALCGGDIDRVVAVPTMISAIAERATLGKTVFSPIRDVLTAGAKLTAKHLSLMRSMFPNARLMEYYGASELGFVSVSTLYPADPQTPIHTVGQAFPGVDIHIRSASGDRSARNEPGTIYVTSDLICDGYLWGDDGKAFRVDLDGATVGDIGEVEPNGALKVIGREGGMVITGGFNVYPSEVEAVLKAIPGIDEAVVLGVEDAYLGTRLVAVLQGHSSHAQTIVKAANAHLPRYKIPRNFFKAQTWPMTSSGKIARGKVAKLLKDGHYDAFQP
jgi:long-chain acyl-CoA synthetase